MRFSIIIMNYFLILFLLCILQGCAEDEDENENRTMLYRSIAYNSISDEDKATIVDDWQDAEVINGTFKSNVCDYEFIQENQGRICFFPKDQNIELSENQNLVAVIFNTVNDPLLGPILVIVDPNLKLAVGYAARL